MDELIGGHPDLETLISFLVSLQLRDSAGLSPVGHGITVDILSPFPPTAVSRQNRLLTIVYRIGESSITFAKDLYSRTELPALKLTQKAGPKDLVRSRSAAASTSRGRDQKKPCPYSHCSAFICQNCSAVSIPSATTSMSRQLAS